MAEPVLPERLHRQPTQHSTPGLLNLKNAHTTIAGIAAGLGIMGHAIAEILKDGWQPADLGLLIAAVGVAMFAYLAEDAKPADQEEKQDA